MYINKEQRLVVGGGSVWWVVVGGWVKFLHIIERRITSVVHSHPPSHYIRTHTLAWLILFRW